MYYVNIYDDISISTISRATCKMLYILHVRLHNTSTCTKNVYILHVHLHICIYAYIDYFDNYVNRPTCIMPFAISLEVLIVG